MRQCVKVVLKPITIRLLVARSEGNMICTTCYSRDPICPECGGCGVVHCCDGLQGQPEPAGRTESVPGMGKR